MVDEKSKGSTILKDFYVCYSYELGLDWLTLCLSHNWCSLNADCYWVLFGCPKWIRRKRGRGEQGRWAISIYSPFHQSLLIVSFLMTLVFCHQHLVSQQLRVQQSGPFLCLLRERFWFSSPTPAWCPGLLPQHPFPPDLLLDKAIQSALEIETLGEIISY